MTTPEENARALGPVAALRRVALLLELAGDESPRARAFRRAAEAIAALPPEEVRTRAAARTLQQLPGIGASTAAIVTDAVAGKVPAYLARLEAQRADGSARPGAELFAQLRGDCHVHSNWSDGGASILEMAEAAIELGHEYIVLSDHSPTLKIANGLTPERLREQLDVVASLNAELAPFRILTGIEVDILEHGALDQEDELLSRLDVVVASSHSLLRMEGRAMTKRMLAAIANPHLDVLGHCTGRMKTGRRNRPESDFDAAEVFAACAELNKAVEINSLPPRSDPPRRLMRQALAAGCVFSLDSDAHAPGQLAWKLNGADRAVECEVPADRIVNTRGVEDLLAWARAHEATSTPATE